MEALYIVLIIVAVLFAVIILSNRKRHYRCGCPGCQGPDSCPGCNRCQNCMGCQGPRGCLGCPICKKLKISY